MIGRRGANIRSIQRQSGAHITLQDKNGWGMDRLCLITGNPTQIERALLLIEASVQISDHRRRGGIFKQQQSTKFGAHLIPAILPETKDFFASFVSAVDGDGGLWIQPVEKEDPALLEALVEKMTSFYSGLSDEVCTLNSRAIGSQCAAPFEHDGKWYRALLVSLPSEEMANVLYVDYGDCGLLPVARLKSLRYVYVSRHCEN